MIRDHRAHGSHAGVKVPRHQDQAFVARQVREYGFHLSQRIRLRSGVKPLLDQQSLVGSGERGGVHRNQVDHGGAPLEGNPERCGPQSLPDNTGLRVDKEDLSPV